MEEKSNNLIYGYARVSTKGQKLERQIEALKKYGVPERFIFSDKLSGKTLYRKQLNELISYVKPGDIIVFKEIDRIGRTRKETKELILSFLKNGIDLHCLDMPYLEEACFSKIRKTDDGFMEILAHALLDFLLEVAEQERKKILKKCSEGRVEAKKRGVKMGRKRKISLDKFEPFYEAYMTRQKNPNEIQNELGISNQSFYNYLNEMKAVKNKKTEPSHT